MRISDWSSDLCSSDLERVEQPLHRSFLGSGAHGFAAAVLFEPHGFLDEVARNLLDIAADIADLGELGRLDFDERCVGELGEAARNLGLAAARGPDHQDVLGAELVAQIGRKLLAAPAVAQRHRDRALRSEEHTPELQSLMRISYAVFCLKKKNKR